MLKCRVCKSVYDDESGRKSLFVCEDCYRSQEKYNGVVAIGRRTDSQEPNSGSRKVPSLAEYETRRA